MKFPRIVFPLLFFAFGHAKLIQRIKRGGIDNVNNKDELWTKMPIPYVINKKIPDVMRNAIITALNTISRQTSGCITFHRVKKSPSDKHDSYIEFQITKSSHCTAEADVGKQDGSNVVQLQDACMNTPNLQHLVLHEVLHVLGRNHEHSRSDRDDYIKVNYANVQDDKALEFYVQNDDKFITYGIPYDYSSVMHYGPYFFSKSKGVLKTIEPVAGKNYEVNFNRMLKAQQRNDMSIYDVRLMKKMYRCD